MFKRLVRTAIAQGSLSAAWIADSTDEALMERMRALPAMPLTERLRRRHLYKRALDLSASEVTPGAGDWIGDDPDLLRDVEDRLAAELRLGPGDVLLDFPRKPEMLAVDLPLRTRAGEITRPELGLQHIADELHRGARRLRAFVAAPVTIAARALLALVERTTEQVRDALKEDRALLR